MLDLVGLAEIARRLGVPNRTAQTWKYRGLLPEPSAVVSGRPVWEWPVIEAWAVRTGRRMAVPGG